MEGASAAFGRRVPLPTAAKGPKRRRGWAPVDRGPQGPQPRTPVLRGTRYLSLGGKSGARDQVDRWAAFRATGPWPSKTYSPSFAPTAPGCPNTVGRRRTGGGLPPPFGSLREGSWHTAGVTEGFLSYHGKSPVTAPPCHPLSRKGALRRRAGPPRPPEGRRGQRPLRKPSGPPVGPAKSRPCLHKFLLLEFAPPPKSPLPNAKTAPKWDGFIHFLEITGLFS